VKANALFGALGKTPARGERSRGRRRTRGESGRFNLEVIFAALIEDAGESGLVIRRCENAVNRALASKFSAKSTTPQAGQDSGTRTKGQVESWLHHRKRTIDASA
jgi:hypothetical protein